MFSCPLQKVIPQRRTVKKRTAPVLACFDRPGASNGPDEATDGCLEHLRRPGFRNLTNYIARITSGDRRIQTPTTPSIVKRP